MRYDEIKVSFRDVMLKGKPSLHAAVAAVESDNNDNI